MPWIAANPVAQFVETHAAHDVIKPKTNSQLKNAETINELEMPKMTEQEFLEIWLNQKNETVELEYRLYYDEQGWPLHYSTEKGSGNYIVVDQQTYTDSPKHIRVVDGKIKRIKVMYGKKLIPATQGQSCHPQNVSVVVSTDQPNKKWAIKYEEPEHDETS
jgi:uncharacterized protein YcfL